MKYFLDLKLHDIPNTVAKAVNVAVVFALSLNIHAAGGRNMMEAAYESLRKSRRSKNPPLLIAVTLLTSISSDDLLELGIINLLRTRYYYCQNWRNHQVWMALFVLE